MKRALLLFSAVLLFCLFLSLPSFASDITKDAKKTGTSDSWFDGDYTTYSSLSAGNEASFTSAVPVDGLYIRFDKIPSSPLRITAGGAEKTVTVTFLHQYLSLSDLFGEAPSAFSLCFPEAKGAIADLYLLSAGELPSFVQTWKPMCEEADLVLCTTHADDEQLFFLGILPTYAGERGYEVQVVYFVNHNDVHDRPHELLNGLWTVGVTHYPMINEMKDYWDGSTKTLEFGYKNFKSQGYSEADIVKKQVEMIRRFRPQVIIGHDLKGEYGHPQHMVNADSFVKALEKCGDPAYEAKGEPYTPQKVYLHLYTEHKITMNWDIPLEAFGGKTAYQVSREGYACHKSQQWTWFTGWIRGKNEPYYTSATQITKHFPTQFGLYFTTVGYDEQGGDFFEHVTARSTIPPETEPVTEPATEPATEPVTDPVTAPTTEPVTEPSSAPVVTEKSDTSSDTAPSPLPGDSGRKKAIYFAVGIGVLIAALLLIGLISQEKGKKKRRRRRSGRISKK